MSLLKATRKIKRAGKTAVQFRVTSTFEFIELECKGTWRPDTLRVVWMRNHRKVKSNDTNLVVTEDFGPNGARGKAIFSPALSVALVVTLYREANQTEFEEKEYKYQIVNDGPAGKKILATFNCNMAEFVAMPSLKQAMDFNFKCISKKVNLAKLGITLESQFMKEGGALDDDMQSTFSAMDPSLMNQMDGEEDDEEEEDEFPLPTAPNDQNRTRLNTLQEEPDSVEVAEKNSLKAPITADPTPHNSGQARKTVDSNETYIPPPNPYLEDDKEEEQVVPKKPSSTETWIDPEAMFVDCFDAVVDREKLDQAELIGLYFSAGWCPPCRRFLPKLVKFYHHLKQHEKSFEIVYISSDYSKQDMMKYMKEQQMPWLGMVYEGDFADRFRKQFNVSAVPLFKIFGTKGELIEESAKKAVEGASNGSAILKLYNKWNEKLMTEEAKELGRTSVTKKGLLSKVRTSVQKQKSKEGEQSEELHSSENMSQKSSSPESGGRKTVDTRTRSKSKDKSVVSQELLDKKEERILHLEEVNKTLKQANEELSEEMDELRQKVQLLTTELEKIKSASKTLEDESKELIANLNMRGWLYKRGIRGPTASIWRRRYFRLDQGSKLYYYKSSSEGTPQGFIDLDKVINVQEVTASQQDKNHATFTIQCDGRNFQLQAHDETGMRKWMEAILYIRNWRKKHSTTISEDI